MTFSWSFPFLCIFQELEHVFSHWPQLLQMDLSGNPVCKKPKYRDRLITVCNSLGEILFIFLLYGILIWKCTLFLWLSQAKIKPPLHNKSKKNIHCFLFNLNVILVFILVFYSLFICIVTLDGREINELTRQFLINWKASKDAKKKKNKKQITAGPPVLYPITSKSFLI